MAKGKCPRQGFVREKATFPGHLRPLGYTMLMLGRYGLECDREARKEQVAKL
jgi:hypothetical protein